MKAMTINTASTFMPTAFCDPTHKLINGCPKKARNKQIVVPTAAESLVVRRNRVLNPSMSPKANNLENLGNIVSEMTEAK